jgi:NADH-quinone oxidoreductase subunit H
VFVWLRGTLPRLRYDQFMALGWKVLVPASLVRIVVVSGIRALRGTDVTPAGILVIGGILLGALVLVAFLLPDRSSDRPSSVQLSSVQRSAGQRSHEVPTAGSDYPLPPLDLVVPTPPRRHAAVTTSGPPMTQEDDHGTA